MKFQAIVLASFLVMPYALADDQGGLKQDAAPPPPHAIEDGYRGTDDAKKMTVDFAKTMHDGASVSLRGNLISHKGEDRIRKARRPSFGSLICRNKNKLA